MLARLAIRDFAIIDRLEVEFEAGFVVVTGETGAGKSILINALHLLLGGRAADDMIRSEADSAEVQGVFELAADSAIRTRLAELDLAEGGQLIIRRVIARNGRNRAFVNDRQVNLATLATLTADLVDISGQHEHVGLTDEASHLATLDAFGDLDEDRREVGEAVRALGAAERELSRLVKQERNRAERQDYLRFALERIDLVDPVVGEDEQLAAERLRLANAERLEEGLRGAGERIYAGEGSAVELIGRASKQLAALLRFDPGLSDAVAQLEACSRTLEDLGQELEVASGDLHGDAGRLEQVEQRLVDLKGLMRAYGPDLAEVIAQRTAMASELHEIEHMDSRRAELAVERDRALAEALRLAAALSERRRQVAGRLAGQLASELDSLAMPGARFDVEVEAGGERALDENGFDRVRFLFSANRGEDLRPLARVASGGELSRVLLALKSVLALVDPVATYVFDEVDSGVGGAVAEALGDKLAAVAGRHQVICITHLPQIAALGQSHFSVRKRQRAGRTVSQVIRLANSEERVEEVARMTAGRQVSAAARELARNLLARASKAAG